jgi:beta-N-acetylhexosaminidase
MILKKIDEMTLEEKAGQLFIIGFNGTRMNDYLREIITEWKIGGLVFSIRNVENPIQVHDLIQEIQDLAIKANGIPLIITINQEGGDRTCFLKSLSRNPGNMSIGATHKPEKAYEVASIVGTELKAMGFNMLFMPVIDMSNLFDNSVLGIRSYGDEPHLVAEMGANFIRGLNDAGIASTAKHFPGAGGSATDAHFDLPYISRTYEQLDEFELIPFKKAIEADVSAMMTAHCNFTKIDKDVIAVMSKKFNTEIAREKLGFQGIMISDAFGMLGLIKHVSPIDACVKSILAGMDIILKRHGRKANFAILEALRESIRSRKIPEERVNVSLERIFKLKEKYCTDHKPDISKVIWDKKNAQKLEAMSEESVTLLRNDENLLPLKLNHKMKVLLIMPDMLANASLDGIPGDNAGYIIRGLLNEKYSYSIDGFDLIHYNIYPYKEEINKVIEKAKNYDVLILGSHRSTLRPSQTEMVKKIFKLGKKVIWVALNIPYDIFDVPEAKTYICTYSERLPQLKALCKIISGEIVPKGRLPVDISGLHSFGEGIQSW